jgi:hypothetical protein
LNPNITLTGGPSGAWTADEDSNLKNSVQLNGSTMLEKRRTGNDQDNEKYRNPNPVVLRNEMWDYLNSLPPQFHQKYHIPSLEVHEGKFPLSRHKHARCPMPYQSVGTVTFSMFEGVCQALSLSTLSLTCSCFLSLSSQSKARQHVSGLVEPHLGELFGTDKETICFYLVHCKLLNNAQGTVEFKEWEGFVSSFPASTKRGTRGSQANPSQRLQLNVFRSRVGLGGQTAQ